MSWLLPSALGVAGVAALAAIALHFIARSRPLAEPLPTARFIPQRPVRARTRSYALSDIVPLLIRLAAILVVGAAVAGPVVAGARGRNARVIVVDRSRAVGSIAAARDSARSLVRAGDILIAFDSTASAVRIVDSIVPSGARGSLSAALAAATRASVGLASQADSVELVLVSPVAAEEVDEATARIRAVWPGRIRLVRSTPTAGSAAPPRVETRENANDAVVAGLSLMGALANAGNVRLIRGVVTAADTAWARDSGHVLLHWPSSDSSAIVWRRRPAIDAIGGVASSSGTLIARFPRLWVLDGRAIARWADGEPAVVEQAIADGCIRDVSVLLDPSSDITLRAPFRAFTRALIAPCGGERNVAALDSGVLATMAGTGPLAPASALRDRSTDSSRWTPWLLAAAALLLLAELAARRAERTLL